MDCLLVVIVVQSLIGIAATETQPPPDGICGRTIHGNSNAKENSPESQPWAVEVINGDTICTGVLVQVPGKKDTRSFEPQSVVTDKLKKLLETTDVNVGRKGTFFFVTSPSCWSDVQLKKARLKKLEAFTGVQVRVGAAKKENQIEYVQISGENGKEGRGIAVAMLKQWVKFDRNAQPICVPNGVSSGGPMPTLMTFGRTVEGVMSLRIRRKIEVLDSARDCKGLSRDLGVKFTAKWFSCTMNKRGSAGSPLVFYTNVESNNGWGNAATLQAIVYKAEKCKKPIVRNDDQENGDNEKGGEVEMIDDETCTPGLMYTRILGRSDIDGAINIMLRAAKPSPGYWINQNIDRKKKRVIKKNIQ